MIKIINYYYILIQKVKQILKELAKELKIEEKLIKEVYKSYWEFIKVNIEQLKIDNINTEEDYSKVKSSFNVPSLGKLYFTYDKINNLRKIKKYKKYVENKKSKTNVY